MAKKKPSRKKPVRKRKPTRTPKAKSKKKLSARKPVRKKKRSSGSEPTSRPSEARIHQGVGLNTGGQSGDNQGLSKVESADSESVEELADEGQDYEAEVVSGIENALDPDQSEVTTKEVPEDDVPEEYRNQEPG